MSRLHKTAAEIPSEKHCGVSHVLPEYVFNPGRTVYPAGNPEIPVIVNAVYGIPYGRIGHVAAEYHADIIHFSTHGKSEQDYLYHRHHHRDKYGAPVPEYVQELLDYRCGKLSHLLSSFPDLPTMVLNTSSMFSARYISLSLSGESNAAILPSTITDTLSQYSASSI